MMISHNNGHPNYFIRIPSRCAVVWYSWSMCCGVVFQVDVLWCGIPSRCVFLVDVLWCGVYAANLLEYHKRFGYLQSTRRFRHSS